MLKYFIISVLYIIIIAVAILNCTDNYDVAKIKMKSVTDHQ